MKKWGAAEQGGVEGVAADDGDGRRPPPPCSVGNSSRCLPFLCSLAQLAIALYICPDIFQPALGAQHLRTRHVAESGPQGKKAFSKLATPAKASKATQVRNVIVVKDYEDVDDEGVEVLKRPKDTKIVICHNTLLPPLCAEVAASHVVKDGTGTVYVASRKLSTIQQLGRTLDKLKLNRRNVLLCPRKDYVYSKGECSGKLSLAKFERLDWTDFVESNAAISDVNVMFLGKK